MKKNEDSKELFEKLRSSLLNIDPVAFIEKYLTLDGDQFLLTNNGYKPFADIYRYVGVKALEKDSLPVIFLKSRQVGGTTLASGLEMYFMGSGLFGTENKPPIRVIHAFPQLDTAAAYTKTKLNPMIAASLTLDPQKKLGVKTKSFMQSLLDSTTDTNNSLHFKQFQGGNHIWIESTGLDADRLRGRTADVIFFDECLVYDTYIETINGNFKIGKLVKDFLTKKNVPKVKTFNEKLKCFEYKEITNAWKKNERDLLFIQCGKIKIKCTSNHKFLTIDGWMQADELLKGSLIKTSEDDLSFKSVDLILKLNQKECVYDIEVKDNHNFFVTLKNKSSNGLCLHNCQDIPEIAINNATKMLTQAKYGATGNGVQLYFGTPKKKGTSYHKMWQASTQQCYYLGCAKCKKHFPLYTPESDDWENVWLYEFIVKCCHCGHEQDKRIAAESGKWIRSQNTEDAKLIGFHINQLYMPHLKKEHILAQKPGIHPTATERSYRNEVLGEFFQGDASPITPEEIRSLCGDVERKFRASITPGEEQMVLLGIDYGARSDLEQLANPNSSKNAGQSYSTAVVLSVKGPGLLSVEFATKFKRNDMDSKKGLIDQIMRQYSVDLAIGDIGYSNDFSTLLHTAYGDRYIVSRAHNKINNHVKFNQESYPKELIFERDYYIGELFELMKKGQIRIPLGDFEKVGWLVNHCSSMEIKPSISRTGDPTIHYVKGSTPNDGFMALLNAYLAYKFLLTSGFTNNNPLTQNQSVKDINKPLVLGAYISRRV